MKLGYEVKNIMSKDIVSVDAAVTLRATSKLMVEKDISSVKVKMVRQMIGILTERDIKKIVFQRTVRLY